MAKRNRKRKPVTQKQKPQRTYKSIGNTLIDVIILVYGRFDLLARCLASIPDAMDDLAYKIILVDNNSPDQQEADDFYARLDTPNIKVLRNKENLGFPRGCNQAVNYGFSSLLFFLNSDVILKPNAVVEMVKQLDEPTNAVCGMKLIFPEITDLPSSNLTRPPGKIQHIGITSNIRGEMVHAFLGWSPDNPRVNKMHDVYAVTGAAMLVRRNLFIKAGKFFEGYGHGSYEDVDLCLTLRSMGYNIVVEPKAEGYHYTGATAQTYNIGFPLQYNQIVFMQRWASKLDWTEAEYL